MYVSFFGQPTLVCPYIGVYKNFKKNKQKKNVTYDFILTSQAEPSKTFSLSLQGLQDWR